MTSPVLAKVVILPGATEFFGKIEATNIRWSPIAGVHIEKYLLVEFLSPVDFHASDFWSQTIPNVDITAVVTNTPKGNEVQVEVKLYFKEPYTTSPDTKLYFAINGNIAEDPKHWTGSFKLTAH